MNPKPFHIGSRVVDTEHYEWVVFAYLDQCVFVTTPERDAYRSFVPSRLTHPGGSPLGEWEPINPNSRYCYRPGELCDDGGPTTSALIPVHEANRIIRGEVEQ